MPGNRRLLGRLREMMAVSARVGVDGSRVALRELSELVAGEMVAEVCTIYALRPGDTLELVATHGLNPEAVGRTRLRVGEGIVGIVAATGASQNLADAQNHPAFAYRPETGEDPYASLLGVPIRRAGRVLGVLTVQNRAPRTYGDDEVEVLETVAMLLAEVLAAAGASDGAEQSLGSTMPRQFQGQSFAPGIAVGPIVVLGGSAPLRKLVADDATKESERLAVAAMQMRQTLDELIAERMPDGPAGDDSREVLEATKLVAAEGSWMRRVREAVAGGLTAEAAVHRATNELRERMRRVADPYIRERLADMEDLAGRLLAALDGGGGVPAVPRGAILFARRLGPAQLLEWHARGIGGIVIEEGSTAGHAAILARALGIPAVGGIRGILEACDAGDTAILDADESFVVLRPDAEVRSAYARALATRSQISTDHAAIARPACTADGTALTLMLNIGLVQEVAQLETTGAAGIGLFRTEIAMLARGMVVDLQEQTALYARVLDAAGGRPVRFRTLDLGGDKMLRDAAPMTEENPAMGWRSLRVGLDRPALLRRQLRALLLASQGRTLSIMFPMVATMAEFRAARGLLFSEVARVRPAPERLLVGCMLEVPALLWQLPALMAEADFVSIGSNDLMQFLFAADRGTPGMAARYDLLSPPVLDLLDQIMASASARGVEVSICGEHASRPIEAMVLAALGLTTLSMPGASLLRLKSVLAGVDLFQVRAVISAARRTSASLASIRGPIASWAREHGLDV